MKQNMYTIFFFFFLYLLKQFDITTMSQFYVVLDFKSIGYSITVFQNHTFIVSRSISL